MKYLLNGVEITGQFDINGAKFALAWVYDKTDEQLAAMGIVRLTEVHPALLANQYEDLSLFTDDLVAKTRTYHIKTKDEINADINAQIAIHQNIITELTTTLIP